MGFHILQEAVELQGNQQRLRPKPILINKSLIQCVRLLYQYIEDDFIVIMLRFITS